MRIARMFALLLVFPAAAISAAAQAVVMEPLPNVEATDPEPVAVPSRELPVFRTAPSASRPYEVAPNSVSTNLLFGDAGEVYLAAPPSGTAGLFLSAKTTALPNITARLGTSDSASQFNVFTAANGPLMVVRGDGRSGFGPTSLGAKLSVFSSTDNLIAFNTTTSTAFEAGSAAQNEIAVLALAQQNVMAGASNPGYLMGGLISAYNSGPGFLQDAFGLRIYTGHYGSETGTIDRAFALRLRVTNPAGTINTAYGVYIEDLPATNAYGLYVGGADDKSYFAGNVGMGASVSSTIRLEVAGVAATYGTARRVARFWDSTNMAAGVGAGVDFLGKYTAAGAYTQFANIKGVKATGTEAEFDGHLVLSVNDDGNMFEAVRIAHNQMTVTGNAHFTGVLTGASINATYQDVAEWVPTTQDLAPGTVVVLDATASNHVVASTRPYDTTVAGVVSPQPGLILGVAGPEKAMIATTGRVKVRVDATAGAVANVTGTKPGLAMKSKPVAFGGIEMHRPGTVVGKALEALPGGEGEILVLLSLQ